ncbi:LysR family transcriptional regulator [uncultured Limosilactobacillus sp.]|uniref:LysR family transcriptional regulator n=1 Tax=uncultured Limosilactobacillus sp. TaxID=2837629 RepID=UPI0025D03869|nr:LysR family transcriptional regulator [uncultured Limosilactobacillus sp.]
MTIEDLRAFVYLYQLRSFTKTAQRIHLSQPELSKRIHHLEDELNVKLVDTSNRRRLKITSEGKAVYRHANKILGQYRQMMNELASLRKTVKPSLVVGAVPITGQYGITTQVGIYNQHFPKAQIRLIENEGDQVLEQLQRGEIDAAILRDTQSGELNELEYSRVNLVEDQLVVVMDCHHPLAKQRQVTIQDLKDVPLVSLPVGSGVYEPIVKMMKDCSPISFSKVPILKHCAKC